MDVCVQPGASAVQRMQREADSNSESRSSQRYARNNMTLFGQEKGKVGLHDDLDRRPRGPVDAEQRHQNDAINYEIIDIEENKVQHYDEPKLQFIAGQAYNSAQHLDAQFENEAVQRGMHNGTQL